MAVKRSKSTATKAGFAARLALINGKYKGDGTEEVTLIGGVHHTHKRIDVIPTTSIGLNYALGVGGFPRGRICEVYGPESGGKSTLALETVAEGLRTVIADDDGAAYIDVENALDVFYCRKLGVDIARLAVSQPESGERVFSLVQDFAEIFCPIVVVDSVAAMLPQVEVDGAYEDVARVGAHAAMMSRGLRKLTSPVARGNTAVIFINQIREKIGGYGDPSVTTGGRGLKFYASIRVEIRQVGKIFEGGRRPSKDGKDPGGEVIGVRARARVVKNKLAPPFREAEFDILFGKGIDRAAELLDLGAKHGIVEQTGAWYSMHGERLGQGRDAAKEALLEHDGERLVALQGEVIAAMDALASEEEAE